jgi:hypothetical protein
LSAPALVDHRHLESKPAGPVQTSRKHLLGALTGQRAGELEYLFAVHGVQVLLHLDSQREDRIRPGLQVPG